MTKKKIPQDETTQQTTPDIDQELQNEIEELENAQEENIPDIPETLTPENDEVARLTAQLTRTQADYQNFKMRSERDKEQMLFFLKEGIFKKILPRIDDLERILKNTPETERTGSVYEWVVALHKTLLRDLSALGVEPYESVGQEMDVAFHEVMTQIPSETPGKIVEEFEKWYLLGDKVLRVAKVIVGM